MEHTLNRRKMLKLLGWSGMGIAAFPAMLSFGKQETMHQRKIPSSGEQLPIVGLGTWLQFDVGSSESARAPLKKVLREMARLGGKMIDTSPMYGRAEQVVGELTTELGLQDQFFYATKVWTRGRQAGINQMESSMRKLKQNPIDLMQVHNLIDWQTHLETMNRWKEDGKIRYTGVTHYTVSAYDELEHIIKNRDIDFVQFNYSIRVRQAEHSLLNSARENNVAVVINRPYEGGSLFGLVKGRQLPNWASDYDINSWGQFFLKYILSHPAVTCVIPGTSDPDHLVDNMKAGYGRMPDDKGRQKMVQFIENL